MLTRDVKFFDIAKNIAKLSSFDRVKIGAIVVLKQKIISVGYNSYKTHPIQMYYNRYRDIPNDANHTLHAEVQALLNVPKGIDLSHASLYTYREHIITHSLAKSRPCPSCIEMIKKMGIKKIYYTTDDGFCEETLV